VLAGICSIDFVNVWRVRRILWDAVPWIIMLLFITCDLPPLVSHSLPAFLPSLACAVPSPQSGSELNGKHPCPCSSKLLAACTLLKTVFVIILYPESLLPEKWLIPRSPQLPKNPFHRRKA